MFTRLKDERGIALVTALLVSMAVLSLSVVVIGLSLHNTSQSSRDRKRIQSVGAAEAGLDAWFTDLGTAKDSAACLPKDYTLTTTPAATAHVTIALYSTWPPADTSLITCGVNPTDPLPAIPLGAIVTSKGTAVASTIPVAVSRTMQAQVRLVPVYGGFGQAIFSDALLDFQNKFTLNGWQANDGDVYTNGNFSLGNNTTIAGSVFAQGSATISQGVVKANVWARNAVSLSSGIEVFGDATSSTSSITLSNNSTIDGNAKAGTTISGGTIKGTKTQNSPSGPPPQIALPQLTFDQQAWIDDGYTINNYSSCALAKNFILAMPAGNQVVRISPACALSFGNNTTVNVRGNLAIVTDGSITTVNQTNWNAVGGGPFTIFFIRPYQAGLNCTKPSPYDVSVSNNTNFNNSNQIFVYTQCNVDFGNNNAGGVPGQIIGGTVSITNQMTMKFQPIRVPGFNLLGYSEQLSFVREITNT